MLEMGANPPVTAVADMEKAMATTTSTQAVPKQRRAWKSWMIQAVLYMATLLVTYRLLSQTDVLDAWPLTVLSCRVLTGEPCYRKRALHILERHPLIDGHNDLAILTLGQYGNRIYGENFTRDFEQGGMPGHVDLPRIDDGRYGGAFWSAFWICPANPYDFTTEAYDPIVRGTLRQIDLLKRLSTAYPHYFSPPASSGEALAAYRKHGTRISPIIIEGLHQIGNSYANLRNYYDLGVRYATLNWNCHNIYSDAALITFLANGTTIPARPYHGGVSIKGRELIREMNRLGMLVDLSHTSVDTMRDALVGQHNDDYPLDDATDDESDAEAWRGSLAPPIFSHSGARAVCPHPRNVPDDVLPLVRRRDAVVMVNFSPDFVSCHYADGADPAVDLPITDLEGATLEKVADHIMHIGETIGFRHVGIGSDYDGIEAAPAGLDGVDKLPDLVAELLRRGVSDEDVISVIGGNILRVWGEAERVAAKLQRAGARPAEDALPPLRRPP